MIKFENLMTAGWEPAIRGMRNAKNSWAKSDSTMGTMAIEEGWSWIGPNDHKLMMNLREAGTDHRKYLRQIMVWVDITAPLYWWKEFDTYKVGTTSNSCSTMHTIHQKEFTLEDFSCEKLIDDRDMCWDEEIMSGADNVSTPLDILRDVIWSLNVYREKYNATKDKKYWDQIIQLLPTSYNQRRTISMSYENLANMYKSRKNHKLDEWRNLCKWIETELPYPELITGGDKE